MHKHTPERKRLHDRSYKCHSLQHTNRRGVHLPADMQKSKSLSNAHIHRQNNDGVSVTLSQGMGRSAQRQRRRWVTPYPQTSPLQRGDNPSLQLGQALYQTSRQCSTHSATLHGIRRGTITREKHLFNEPSPSQSPIQSLLMPSGQFPQQHHQIPAPLMAAVSFTTDL